jgi:hypothetical protein
MYTEQVTQRQAIMNGVPPQTLNNSRAFTNGVDMLLSRRAFFTVYIGTVTAGSISAWLQESSDNFVSDIPSNDTASPFSNSLGASTSSTGNVTSNSILTFEVRAGQLTKGKRYVRLEVKEVNGSNTNIATLAMGEDADHKPNSLNNGTAVVQQNVVS